MARSRRRKDSGPSSGWLVTFADLITLLLTFFVLLLSMSSLTQTLFVQVDSFFSPRNYISFSRSGNIPQRILMVLNHMREPDTMELNRERIKDLLFPLDALPDEMDREWVKDNIDVIFNEQGVVIVMTDSLLFAPGEYTLSEANKRFLAPLYDVLLYANQDINISAHTDDQIRGMDSYELSALRALSVLDYFLYEANVGKALKPNRFSISAYGADRPAVTNSSPEGRAKNRRVEIMLKNEQWLGSYP